MVADADRTLNTWRKSTYSGGGGSNCVEVGDSGAKVLVRDTKKRDGDTLNVGHREWRRFVGAVKGFG